MAIKEILQQLASIPEEQLAKEDKAFLADLAGKYAGAPAPESKAPAEEVKQEKAAEKPSEQKAPVPAEMMKAVAEAAGQQAPAPDAPAPRIASAAMPRNTRPW
jgi:hypothetical protein